MCLPALAAVPAMLASAGSAVAGAAAAIPGFASVAGAAGKAFTFAKTAKGIGVLQAGTGVLGSVLDYMGQRQESAMQDALYEQNRINAIRAYQDDIVSLNTDTMIAQEQATDRRLDLNSQALAEGAAARVSTGEAGFEGFSAAAIQRDILMAKGTGIAAIDRNERLDAVRYQSATRAAGETATGRIQSVQRGRKPSLLALGLGVATAGISGMSTAKSLSNAAKVA